MPEREAVDHATVGNDRPGIEALAPDDDVHEVEGRLGRGVKALRNGKATGADWILTADTIDLRIADRLLQQTFAWGDSSRPTAVSTLNTIQSD